jgi:hypothetical protein
MRSFGFSNPFELLSPAKRHVVYVLLTRSPLNYNNIATTVIPYDLHVLGTPPALVLSQDQTLHKFMESLKLEPAHFVSFAI